MKKVQLFLGVMTFLIAMACSSKPKGEEAQTSEPAQVESQSNGNTYNVSTDASTVNWTGTKIGGSHTGTLGIKSGSINVENGNITGGKFTMDMNAIVNTDMEDATDRGKLEGHLKSPDFFDVAKFPTSSFEITKTTALTNDAEANALIYGNLTIKGVTKQISFKAKTEATGNTISVKTAPFTIDRTEFNVQYASAKFFDNLKDKAINDQIGVQINVMASK